MVRQRVSIVRKWREQCGLSQREAAQLLEMSPQRYNYFERFGSTLPHDALRIMASAWSEKTQRTPHDFYSLYHESC